MPRRRRFKFQCGHLGLGAECHRCQDAARLEVRANEVEAHFDAVAKSAKGQRPKDPPWLYVDDGFRVRGLTKTFAVPKSDKSTIEIGCQIALAMREEADRLRKPQKSKSRTSRAVSSEASLADQVS